MRDDVGTQCRARRQRVACDVVLHRIELGLRRRVRTSLCLADPGQDLVASGRSVHGVFLEYGWRKRRL